MAEETDARLAKMRRALVKLRREGREREFAVVADAYGRLKAEQMEAAEREQRAVVRARRAQQRAVEVQQGSGVWRLPSGFASPLAAERARSGWRPREEPVRPAGGLNPWRRGGSPMTEQIWRP